MDIQVLSQKIEGLSAEITKQELVNTDKFKVIHNRIDQASDNHKEDVKAISSGMSELKKELTKISDLLAGLAVKAIWSLLAMVVGLVVYIFITKT